MTFNYVERPRQWIKTYNDAYIDLDIVNYFIIDKWDRQGASPLWLVKACENDSEDFFTINILFTHEEAQIYLDQLMIKLGYRDE